MGESPKPIIDVRCLERSFGEGDTRVWALRGVDLTIYAGEFVAVMGPSGSGKSTLLHLIGGLDTPTAGSILIENQDLSRLDDDALTLLRRNKIGFVFQAFNLIQVLTAEENVALPLVLGGVAEPEAARRAGEALERTGVAGRRSHLPRAMSGGEQQRVALSRALVNDPLILLADEPTGNLDSAAGDAVLALLRQLVDQRGQTILMVTHEPRYARMADRIVFLRDGRIVEGQDLPAAPNVRAARG